MRTTTPTRLPTPPLALASPCSPARATATARAGGTADTDTGGGDCPSDAEFFEASDLGPDPLADLHRLSQRDRPRQGHPHGPAARDADGYLEHNLAEAREIARVDVGGTSLLLLKPTNKPPDGHKGGMVVAEGSPENHDALAEFVAAQPRHLHLRGPDGDEAAACDKGGAGVRRVRRLSHVEYNRSLAAMLGAAHRVRPHLRVRHRRPRLLQQRRRAGRLRPARRPVPRGRRGRRRQPRRRPASRLGCDPVADGEAECATTFITNFGKQAFRRPLTATEVARYQTLWSEAAEAEDFAGGIRWVIAAMLQSPGFLYRSELGDHVGDGIYQLTAHELASELSYLIVGGPPDAALDRRRRRRHPHRPRDASPSTPSACSPATTATPPCTGSSTSGCTSTACPRPARRDPLPRADPADPRRHARRDPPLRPPPSTATAARSTTC
jgi:hypothetical protein